MMDPQSSPLRLSESKPLDEGFAMTLHGAAAYTEAMTLSRDSEHIWKQSQGAWHALAGRRLFLTGGTGFFGRSFLEAFHDIRRAQGLELEVTLLTRDADRFRSQWPHLAEGPGLRMHSGELTDFRFLDAPFDYVLHAGASASAKDNAETPSAMFRTVVQGTERVLEQARRSGAKRLLFVSSGAVYGRQPPDLAHLPETYLGAPIPQSPLSAYGEGKRAAELLCALASRDSGIEIPVARCFAFVGPHLPLDGGFAIGNFIRDCLENRQIRILGDGTPLRSYLYSADLVSWLLTLLTRGRSGVAYNVGSEDGLSIHELAERVVSILGSPEGVSVAKAPGPGLPERYVPSAARAREEFGLQAWISLPEAIRRTAEYHMKMRNPDVHPAT